MKAPTLKGSIARGTPDMASVLPKYSGSTVQDTLSVAYMLPRYSVCSP